MKTALALTCLVFLAAAPARADDALVNARYGSGDLARDIYFASNTPKGAFRSRVADAAETWKALPLVLGFEIHKSPSVAVGTLTADPCARVGGVAVGGVLWGPIPGNTLAENRNCGIAASGQLVAFRQTYNRNAKIFRGKGKPPNDKYDLQSIATHELGHALGWNGDHYRGLNNGRLCSDHKGEATMCPLTYPGTKWERNLHGQDKQEVLSAYSQPLTALSADTKAFSIAPRPPARPALGESLPETLPGARGCVVSVLKALRARRGSNQLVGGAGAQKANLGGGLDLAIGKGGEDCITGGPLVDDLRGGGDNDTLVGGQGADILVGDFGSDLLIGGPGDDQIYAADGTFDSIRCGPGQDSVFTADPADTLFDCELPASSFTEIPLPPDYVRAAK